MTWIFLGGEKRWVHAHTEVKTHLIGPADLWMVARSIGGAPSHASVRVERRPWIDSWWGQGERVGGRAMTGMPGVPCKKNGPKRMNYGCGPNPMLSQRWCRSRSIDH